MTKGIVMHHYVLISDYFSDGEDIIAGGKIYKTLSSVHQAYDLWSEAYPNAVWDIAEIEAPH